MLALNIIVWWMNVLCNILIYNTSYTGRLEEWICHTAGHAWFRSFFEIGCSHTLDFLSCELSWKLLNVSVLLLVLLLTVHFLKISKLQWSLNSFRQHTHTRLTALCPGLPGWAGTRKANQSGFYWSKRQWVTVASARTYASLHLVPDR